MSDTTQGENPLRRLQSPRKAEGKPVLVSMMILVGDDGNPARWFLSEYTKGEGMRPADLSLHKDML